MPELFPQQLKANFTPDQQDYYLQLENELDEIKGGRTEEEIITVQDFKTLQRVLDKKQEMLNFVLTKKTREMVRQEEVGRLEREKRLISLDEIERKQNAGEELTDNELKFLYRIDGFGLSIYSNQEDKKEVEKIIEQRNIKKDVSRVLGCDEDQVSLTKEEFLDGTDIVYHFGNLDLNSITSAEGLELPQSIGGNLNLESITSVEGLQLPQSIGGSLYLFSITSAEGLQFPSSIGGNLDLRRMTSAEGLQLPQIIGGNLYLDRLTSAEGLQLPQIIGGTLYLGSITSAEGLQLPPSIGGDLFLRSLTSAEGLEIPLGVKSIYFKKMPDNEIEKLKQKYPHVKVTKT